MSISLPIVRFELRLARIRHREIRRRERMGRRING